MSELDAGDLRAVFDEQLRGTVPSRLPAGVQVELHGPLTCFFGTEGRGYVDYRDLGGLEGAELDELIARCIDRYAARGERFEWKTFGHDRPADLAQRLVAAGFAPQERETVVVASVATIAAEPPGPDRVRVG